MTQSATVKQDEALLAEIKARDANYTPEMEAGIASPSCNDRRTLLRLLSACQARVEEAEKDATISRAEMEQQRFKNESLVSTLVSFRLAVPPAPIEVDGKTYKFVPPDPQLYLQQLRIAIERAEANEQVRRDERIQALLALGADGGGTKT